LQNKSFNSFITPDFFRLLFLIYLIPLHII